jgi:hypothetical protein
VFRDLGQLGYSVEAPPNTGILTLQHDAQGVPTGSETKDRKLKLQLRFLVF